MEAGRADAPPPGGRALPAWIGRAAAGAIPVLLAMAAFSHLLIRNTHFHGEDDLEFAVPFVHFLRKSLLEGGFFPLFNPYTDSGLSFFSRLPLGEPFYPTVFLFFFLPAGWALNVAAFLHIPLAALGTFLFARRVGLGQRAALVPALAYPLSSLFRVAVRQGYLPVVVSWTLFPFLLLATEAAFQALRARDPRSTRRWVAGGGLILGLLLLGGHAEHDLAVCLVWVAWGAIRLLQAGSSPPPPREERRGGVLVLGGMALAGLGLAMVFWLPVLCTLWTAGGLPHDIEKFLEPSREDLASFLLPMWKWGEKETTYVGVTTLLLVFVSPLARRFRAWLPAALLAAFSFILFLGDSTPVWGLLRRVVPFFGGLHYSHVFAWAFLFFAALLAGITVEAGLESPRRRLVVPLACMAGALFAISTGLSLDPFTGGLPGGPPPFSFHLPFLVFLFLTAHVLLSSRSQGGKARALIVLTAIDLGIYQIPAWDVDSGRPVAAVDVVQRGPILDALRADSEPGRLLPLETRLPEHRMLFQRNGAMIDELETISIAGHLPRASYAKLLSRLRGLNADWRDFTDRRFPMRGHEDLADDPANARILDLLNARFVLTDGAELVEKEIATSWPWRLYRRETALPRACLVFDWEPARSEDACVARVLDPTFDIHRRAMVQGEEPPIPPGPSTASGLVGIVSRRPGLLVLETNAPARALLLLSEIADEGWHASVDGLAARTHVADCWLTGVFLEPGTHEVELEFRPPGWLPGIVISLGSLAAILAMLAPARARKSPRRRPEPPC